MWVLPWNVMVSGGFNWSLMVWTNLGLWASTWFSSVWSIPHGLLRLSFHLLLLGAFWEMPSEMPKNSMCCGFRSQMTVHLCPFELFIDQLRALAGDRVHLGKSSCGIPYQVWKWMQLKIQDQMYYFLDGLFKNRKYNSNNSCESTIPRGPSSSSFSSTRCSLRPPRSSRWRHIALTHMDALLGQRLIGYGSHHEGCLVACNGYLKPCWWGHDHGTCAIVI